MEQTPTQPVKRPRGRPITNTVTIAATDTAKAPTALDKMEPSTAPYEFGHVGKFICVNTRQIKGLRLNLEKVRQYAMQNENTIGIAWDNGTQTALQYGTEKEALEMLEKLDEYCL